MDYAQVFDIGTKLGVAGFGIGAVTYVALKLTENHSKQVVEITENHLSEINEAREERKKQSEAFINFVNTNNHQKTEIVKESTEAMIKVGHAIEVHTEVLKQYLATQNNK